MARGVNINNLKKSHFEELRLPLAPLNEQRRIAAKLDTTLAVVEACRQRLDGVEALLKRFRQAVLAAATSGELTREWREERGSKEEPLKSVQLGDVIREMRNGLSPKPSMTPPGVKILRIGAIRPGSIDFEDCRYLDLTPKDAGLYALRDGDLIFTCYNGTLDFVGVCALVRSVPGAYVYPDKLIRVRCNEGVALPAFIELAFGSTNARVQIELLVKSSAGQKGISGADLKGIRFGLPSIYEQVEIVRRTRQLFSLADQLEAKLNSARQVVERLTPALLAKAFRGELVPQDPSDEPASLLLERIRAARQAEAAAGKPSRRGRRKAADPPEQAPRPAAPAPLDLLAQLLQECGALSERALLAASELDPACFRAQLALEQGMGAIRETAQDGQVLLEAVG
jgi:type I restriction enzyme S subunit